MSYSTTAAYSTSPMIILLAIAVIIGIIIYFKSKKTLCIKIILSLIPVVISLCIIVFIPKLQKGSTDCFNSNNDLNTTEETNFFQSETSSNNTTTPLSKWGFNNLSEMENYLIRINGYNLDGNNPYVYFESRTKYDSPTSYLFENGYWFNCEFSGDDTTGYTLKKRELAGLYSIIDNDSIYWYGSNDSDSGSSYMITERITALENNLVILEMGWDTDFTEWYIPYSLIDWEKGVCEYKQNGEYACYYKLYLKG